MLISKLKEVFTPESVAADTNEQRTWQAVGNFYKNQYPPRVHEALGIFAGLYDHMLVSEANTGIRAHKGMPLVWMSDCYDAMGYQLIARRY